MGNFFEMMWLRVLNVTVNNGYKGEWNFFWCTLVIIATFSIIYYTKLRSVMESYITTEEITQDNSCMANLNNEFFPSSPSFFTMVERCTSTVLALMKSSCAISADVLLSNH